MLVIKIMEVRPGVDDTTVQELHIPSEHGPALRSAIAEIRNELADRVTGSYRTKREAALTRALAAVSALAGGINKVVRKEDLDYGKGKE